MYRQLTTHWQDYQDKKTIIIKDKRAIEYKPTATFYWEEVETRNLGFSIHYHPKVCEFIKALNQNGIPGLLAIDIQKSQEISPPIFEEYEPTDRVDKPYQKEAVDFSLEGSYSPYNRELFLHIPSLIFSRLAANQRFEDAQKWLHYIFFPMDSSDEESPKRYWHFLPFKDTERESVEDLLIILSTADDQLDEAELKKKRQLEEQVDVMRLHPFEPHRIARLRENAYKKSIVMKYIDNLIAWGDQLFRRDTIESINEATQLYILAANILGPKPQPIPHRGKPKTQTFNSLRPMLESNSDALAECLVSFENDFPVSTGMTASTSDDFGGLLGTGKTLYFCIPQNDKLIGYFDTVQDRLIKIRNCMNIEGVVRELPLFEPPIDPALLVRAAAAGVDISSVLNDMSAPVPYYRFNVMIQKAAELCAEVKALGAALLSAIEKRDAEGLALLRSHHEIELLKAVREVKTKQIEEAQAILDGLRNYEIVVTARKVYYSNRPDRIPEEDEQLECMSESRQLQQAQQALEVIAGSMHLIPESKIGVPTTLGSTFGGFNIGAAISAAGSALGIESSRRSTEGSISGTLATYKRRRDDWNHQADLASKELEQVKKQIEAANVRIEIAKLELKNHDTQVENAQSVDEYMRNKFSNLELYQWMTGQISTIFFQSYQMVYDLAKRAERAYRFERGLTTSNFIKFGYWDSLRKGLLAGEQLHYDIKRLEVAYLEQNKREYEITKNISLLLHDPLALITLKETGQCEFILPEMLFDADYAGHYMRRIKSLSLTIPCVVGPYTSINCTLTLLSNNTRIKSSPSDSYPEREGEDDDRFVHNFAAMQSIATSSGQNDSGTFEVNFRDDRFLPFEGAGVISRWRMEMLQESNAFDLDTLSDVVLHLRYTAREGGAILKKDTSTALNAAIADAEISPLGRLFSAKHEFPGDWYHFLHPTEANSTVHTLQLALVKERFPFQFRNRDLTISQVTFFMKLKNSPDDHDVALKIKVSYKNIQRKDEKVQTLGECEIKSDGSPIKALPFSRLSAVSIDVPSAMLIEVSKEDLSNLTKQDTVDDIWIVCEYSVALPKP